jgi:hypothetical protein
MRTLARKSDRVVTKQNPTFLGAAIDTGAQRSVIGIPQAQAYCRQNGIPMRLKSSNSTFVFADQRCKSLGVLKISLPTPESVLQLDVDVVQPDIPMLLGLDILDSHGLQFLSTENALEAVEKGWKMPVVRKDGHAFIMWPNDFHIMFSRSQLERLHRHFVHPSAVKLHALLRRATPESLPDDTMKVLQDIRNACHTCQAYSRKPMTFQVRFPNEVVFNQEVSLDIYWLEKKPALSIVDAGTGFCASRFLAAENVETVWNTFLEAWSLMYVGFPQSVLTDQGSVFLSAQWKHACDLGKIHLRHTGTESHNSLGAGEQIHSKLRAVFRKLTFEHPKLSPELRLSIAVKALNDTAGPDGLVPSLLVFGALPRPPEIRKEFPAQRARFQAMHTARAEYERLVSAERIRRGLRKQVTPAADRIYSPGDHVYVYRERLKHWTGPHEVAFLDGKDVRVHVGERGGPRSFNSSAVKPAPTRAISDGGTSILHAADDHSVSFTEVLSHNDPRARQFDNAKREEILGLIQRGTFKLVLRSEQANPNVLPARFVLAIKNGGTDQEILKARFVLGGHKDRDKMNLVHNATTLKQSSVRLLLALSAVLGFELWTMDVRQAYLQAASNLKRDVFIRPHELELSQDELLQVIKPLYGLSDSGDYWSETLVKHHLRALHMSQATADFSLFFRTLAGDLTGLSGTHVDDLLQAGTPKFRRDVLKETRRSFDVKDPEEPPLIFTGIEISRSGDGIIAKQGGYISTISKLVLKTAWECFRSERQKLAWICQTRPDIACAVSFLQQVVQEKYSTESLKAFNRVVLHLQRTPKVVLKFPPLDRESLRLVVYADASFHNCSDNASQLGYIIVLADASDTCAVLHFSSHKSKRVTRSTMAAETLAFVDAFDNAFILRHELSRMMGTNIPILMMTDSRALFDVITRARYTTERRLMVDIAAAREAYKERTMSNIGLIRSEFNPADGLTKVSPNDALLKLLTTSSIDHPIEQFVVERDHVS